MLLKSVVSDIELVKSRNRLFTEIVEVQGVRSCLNPALGDHLIHNAGILRAAVTDSRFIRIVSDPHDTSRFILCLCCHCQLETG